MIKNNLPVFNQALTLNKEGKKEYISTGATLNNLSYISLPVVLAIYDVSDPTLRKYIRTYGKDQDSFLSDGKLYINTLFLKKNRIFYKAASKETYYHYRKTKIKGQQFPYTLLKSENKLLQTVPDLKSKLDNELKNINWDYFISINPKASYSKDFWDNSMLKLADILGYELNDPNIKIAYSTEIDVLPNFEMQYKPTNRRHIHILICKNNSFIKIETIKGFILRAMNRKKFNLREIKISMYDKNDNATGYILKQLNFNKDAFSLVVPHQ